MTPDQIATLLAAAQKTLAGRRDLFDYVPLFTPLLAAPLGWIAAYLQFRASFKKGLEKEHYYASKQNVLDILKLQGDFLKYLYEFYRSAKNDFSHMKPLPIDFLSDFVTSYNSKLATIHLMRRIEFPGSTFDDRPTIDLLKSFESHIARMDEVLAKYLDTARAAPGQQQPLPITQEEANRYSEESKRLIDAITTEISLQDNIMVKILSDEAKRLGITTQMPKILKKTMM